LSLFPIRVKRVWGKLPGSQAVTFPDFATCEDGLDYALKLDGTAHTHVRASEYVCCRLAEIVGLPLPNFRVVEHLNGDLVFASQIFGDIRQNAADQAGLLRFLTKNSPPPEIVTQMSRVYAFDLFVNNIDRHINNFMFQKQNKKNVVLAIDFSKAIFNVWPLPNGPMNPGCGTVFVRRLVERHWGFDLGAAKDCSLKIGQVPKQAVTDILHDMPTGWLPQASQNQLLAWWSAGAHSRASDIWKGLDNGTYL